MGSFLICFFLQDTSITLLKGLFTSVATKAKQFAPPAVIQTDDRVTLE